MGFQVLTICLINTRRVKILSIWICNTSARHSEAETPIPNNQVSNHSKHWVIPSDQHQDRPCKKTRKSCKNYRRGKKSDSGKKRCSKIYHCQSYSLRLKREICRRKFIKSFFLPCQIISFQVRVRLLQQANMFFKLKRRLLGRLQVWLLNWLRPITKGLQCQR